MLKEKPLSKTMTKREFQRIVPQANERQLMDIGFKLFKKINGCKLLLIPKALFKSIPTNFQVVDIFGKAEHFNPNTSDDDERFGCLSYGVVVSGTGESLNKKKNNLEGLVKDLKDPEYRQSWVANIAMSFLDNWSWYAKKKKKTVMSFHDRHKIANNAAEYFLGLLCKDINTKDH